ncbi:hypothetical protein [Actinoplanes regularis]|uniref:hypothetical protein n=1 Tax=Actinoplanes regularis TaxID=52697 RepID=UPI0015C5B591|nr:hypothetical protein [Actinoplanes regularis]
MPSTTRSAKNRIDSTAASAASSQITATKLSASFPLATSRKRLTVPAAITTVTMA